MNNEEHDIENSPETAGSRSVRRRSMTIGLAGGLLAGTAAGLVFGIPGLSNAAVDTVPAAVVQQTDDTESTPSDSAEPGTRLRDVLQALVDDGTITSEQADAVTQHLVENRPERGAGGHGGHGGPGGRHGGLFGAGVASEVLTDLLGIDAEELRTQLRDGATLAEIAEAQGVETQAVVDALVAELTERIDAAVADGRIDQATADEKLAEAEAKIADRVENGRPERLADADEPADTVD